METVKSTVKISGDKALLRRLTQVVKTLGDPKDMLDAIGSAMSESTRLRFTDQEDIHGETFKPSYRALAQGGQTLLDRGLLRNSITYFADKHDVEWGVPKEFPYAWILNEGGVIKPKTKPALKFKVGGRFVTVDKVVMPRREFLGISSSDRKEVLAIIKSFIGGSRG